MDWDRLLWELAQWVQRDFLRACLFNWPPATPVSAASGWQRPERLFSFTSHKAKLLRCRARKQWPFLGGKGSTKSMSTHTVPEIFFPANLNLERERTRLLPPFCFHLTADGDLDVCHGENCTFCCLLSGPWIFLLQQHGSGSERYPTLEVSLLACRKYWTGQFFLCSSKVFLTGLVIKLK